MKRLVSLLAGFVACTCFGYQVSVGTYVSNAGKTVSVPVSLDSTAGLAYAGATITYDPQVLVVTKVEVGTLKSVMAEDFVSFSTNGSVTVTAYGSMATNVVAGSGTIATVTFAVRAGTEGRYSDITVSDVDLGECTGVKDVTIGNPLMTRSGMVRVVATGADVTRLESAQVVCADTRLGNLALSAGDALQASDLQTPVIVSGEVSAVSGSEITILAPVNGWAGGRYALLKTATAGLALKLADCPYPWTVTSEAENGVTTYYADVVKDETFEIESVDGETLSSGTKNQIRALLAGKLPANVTKLSVSGPTGLVPIIADMGIAPLVTVNGTEASAVYRTPMIKITSFDPSTGAVGIKVVPGEGNTIVSEIATGYLHVYGTDNLAEKMRYISKVGFDLTPYLKEETKGEATLTVTLGTHTFLKVKVEAAAKSEGDVE